MDASSEPFVCLFVCYFGSVLCVKGFLICGNFFLECGTEALTVVSECDRVL